jgi:hypothetical protein
MYASMCVENLLTSMYSSVVLGVVYSLGVRLTPACIERNKNSKGRLLL